MKKQFQKWSKITILTIAIVLGMPFASSLKIDSINTNNPILSSITFYVGGNGPNNYTKIQDAINDSDNEDIIFVYNGIYYENVIVNKSVFLYGQDMYSTIIDGGIRDDFDTVHINADDVTLSGFTIQNSGEEPFDPDCGVDVRSDGNMITGNRIINNNYGLNFYYCNDNIVTDNLINENSDTGIILGDWTLNTVISHNIIIENEGDGIHCGGGWYEDHYSEIYGNQISYNGINGIDIGKCNYYLISENTINGNRFNGILCLNDVSNYNILGNEISFNSEGIDFKGNNNTIVGNSITHNYRGLKFNGADDNNLTNNDISHNIEMGFLLGFSNGNSICQNNFVNNSMNCFIVGQKTDNNYLNGNYWDRFKVLPKIIFGVEQRLEWIFDNVFIPKFYFDMNPSSEPYDI